MSVVSTQNCERIRIPRDRTNDYTDEIGRASCRERV